jgi:S1-C subfamily serine protease
MVLILTAHHVADGDVGQAYLITTEAEQQLGVLIYSDPLNDIALIYPTQDFVFAKPMKWKAKDTISVTGLPITYSGYPSWHSLLSFRGNIAGYELLPGKGQQIILQTYGYFGSSGSVVYDADGYIVGILWGIDVQRDGVHENIVWVSPIQNLNIKLALEPLCVGLGEVPKACR